MGKVAGRKHSRKLAALILISLMNTFCASIDRKKTETTFTMSSGYARAGHNTYGCEGGEIESEQRHHQGGGKAALRVEHRNGGIGQLDLGFAYGKSQRTSGIKPLRHEYLMGTLGAMFGWDFQDGGFDLGFNILWSDCDDFCDSPVLFIPRFEIRLGEIDKFWFEAGAGALDALFDGRGLYAGLGLKTSMVDLNFGVAGVGRPMVDLGTDELIVGSLADMAPDLGGYARLSIHLGESVTLNLGGILAENFSLQLGLGFRM